MGDHDPRVDAYIAKAAPFARPVLEELRARVHAACPAVVETIKWGRPAFEHHGLLASMASFQAHCAFGFWKHDLVVGDAARAREAMGSLGRLTGVADLPAKRPFAALVKEAARLNEQGVVAPRAKTRPKEPVAVHPELERALSRSKKARATFDALAPSHRREYVEWVAEAKRDETRARRIAQTVEWLAEGKRRNWKYEQCRDDGR